MDALKDLMSLKGRTALVTGATGGIGRQMALTIAELGGDLVLTDRPGVDYGSLTAEINQIRNVQIDLIDCDLENEGDRKKLCSQVGQLDILINNAAFVGESGLDGWVSDFESQTIETWRRALEVNLTAAFDLTKGFARKLRKSGRGSVVNVASIYGVNGPDYSLYTGTAMGNPAAYSVSKGGMIQMTRWLATTMAPDIRVNAISPGGVIRNQPDEFVQRYEQRTPLNRMATEKDFKGVTAFLVSDMSSYVTGQNLLVDGGWTSW